MKVLILSNNANGMYLFRKEVLTALLDKGYTAIISLPHDEYCSKLEALGLRIIPTEFERRGSNPVHDFRLFLKYLGLLKDEKPDVVLTYTIKPNLYGGLACRIKRIPYIINVTGLGTALESPGILGNILLKFYRTASQKAACVFFQNSGNRQFMIDRGIAMDNNRLLPGSGVNLDEHYFSPYPSENEGIVFLAVLRIMRDKGIAEYLKAAERIKREYPETKFCLAGEYEEETREIYEPEINRLSAEGILEYFGHIDNVSERMEQSHVIVHPSYHEGLSNVLLEAAACGRPILASDVPGCRETMQQGVSGLLFEPGDSESLIKTIKILLGYTEFDRKEMGLRGREYVENVFDRSKVVNAYLEEIENIVTDWRD